MRYTLEQKARRSIHRAFIRAAIVAALSLGAAAPAPAQQSTTLAGATGQALVSASTYLHDQMQNGSYQGRVEFDARSLTRLVPDSALTLRPRMAEALGVGLADEGRLDSCKPVHSAACELGTAQAVLEVRSATISGTHGTVEIRKYERRAGSTSAMSSVILRFDLVLASSGWIVSKYAVLSG